ncbi:SDR family oxidoreductase [Variovorax sp. J22R115]|uniref:UDP-glucose 4-epimerase family protein n=1 Tax=Variovorax sp. J22R115 TaxID=3053509 RepID=UPI002576BC8D|nr:SDR family oxidoreductase [Variovorax sp. J22R115]MDM0053471.1 SDR family oxidoreductase [Variovorax sp. J22R115]
MSEILITGATGFVGAALLSRLCLEGHELTAVVRQRSLNLPLRVKSVVVGNIDGGTYWGEALYRQDVVVHCAARVHVMREDESDPLMAFRLTNLRGTLNLARQAAKAGVRRFIFISSIGVNGSETFDTPFSAETEAAPHSSYAISKHEAEIGLREIAEHTGLEVVIVRPPLVYGPSAPGNFATLVRWLQSTYPIPLGAVKNRRSYVSLDNLVDLLATCVHHPLAADQIFLVSDGEDLSIAELLRRMGSSLGKPARLIPVPPSLLKVGAKMIGKPELAQRLCGSLQVDIAKTRRLLSWTPPVSVHEGLRRAAEGYLREASV